MSRSARRSSAPPSKFLPKLLLWGVPIFFLLLVFGFLIGRMMIESYLRSDNFRQFVANKAGVSLKSQCELAPLQYTGMSVYTDNFTAQGGESASFSKISLDQFRAEISLRKFFDHVWQVDQVDIQRLMVDLTGPRVDIPNPGSSASKGSEAVATKPGWLPNRVEITSTTIHDANALWKGGAMKGATFTVTPENNGWSLVGQGGKINQENLPALDIEKLRLFARDKSVFIKEAEFRQGHDGTLKASGEAVAEDHLDLQTTIDNFSVTPFLSGDWRVRLTGNVSGEINVRTPLPVPASGVPLSGSLHLNHGELTALPVLDQIATFTAMQQFRHLNLSRAEGDFSQDGKRLDVTKFVLEAEGLLRIEGSFTVQNSIIHGSFQVGVTPSSLQWLPGSREKVFKDQRGAYVWTPMTLDGPLDKPKEDLTPRLVQAMQGAVIDTATNAVEQGIKTGQDAIKGALQLFGPGSK